MIHRSRSRRRGVAAAETAMVLPLILVLLFGIIEFSRFIMTRQLCVHAAQEGARYAVVHVVDSTSNDLTIQNEVDERLIGLGIQFENYNKTQNIQVYQSNPNTGGYVGSWRDAGFGDPITVHIQGVYKPLIGPLHIPLPGGGVTLMDDIQITAEASSYSEAN